ncbi:hypothetical protein ACLOJK_011853 [Asimina triloba]
MENSMWKRTVTITFLPNISRQNHEPRKSRGAECRFSPSHANLPRHSASKKRKRAEPRKQNRVADCRKGTPSSSAAICNRRRRDGDKGGGSSHGGRRSSPSRSSRLPYAANQGFISRLSLHISADVGRQTGLFAMIVSLNSSFGACTAITSPGMP